MNDESRGWLHGSRATLERMWQDRLQDQGFVWSTKQLRQVFECLQRAVEDAQGDAVTAGEATLSQIAGWGNAGIEERIACIRTLHKVILERLVREGVSAPYAVLTSIAPVFDHWLLELGQTRGQREREALLSHNQKLSERLAKQTENMQAALTRLEKLERTKSDFISIAAHELKTPLTLVRGYGTILAEDIQGKEEQELVALATGIVQGTERLGQIIDDMIDVALLDLDTLDWRREIVYLDKLIDMAVTEVKATAHERGVAIHIHAPADLPVIEGDSQRLYQVFLRVIGNGVKYTPDGGQIDISFRHLHTASLDEDDKFIELVVADTGIGVDPDEQEWIFEKFYRIGDPSLHSTSKARFKGAGPGLGLTIARGIVQAHGGMMWVESPGYDEAECPGSEFHIVLPARFGRKVPNRPGRPAFLPETDAAQQ